MGRCRRSFLSLWLIADDCRCHSAVEFIPGSSFGTKALQNGLEAVKYINDSIIDLYKCTSTSSASASLTNALLGSIGVLAVFTMKERMVNAHHKEVLKASTSKGVKPSASDTDHGNSDNGSSSTSEDLNFRGFITYNLKTPIYGPGVQGFAGGEWGVMRVAGK
uniref:Uncharacterized protein n=1 Tax=Tanacetum cinerariifolium TaxID=118510 RepID=A0A6L2N1S8_TANCI|nr:hypothetical protein [Tanacetum cinerariifolium]